MLKFTINPTAFINRAVDTVTVTAGTATGQLSATPTTNIVVNLTTATVTKTLTV